MARHVVASVMVLSSLLGLAKPAAAADEGGQPAEVGEVEEATVAVEPVPVEPAYGVWDRLAACESNGRWGANTGNGYYGGLQFDLPSWRAAGGIGRPDQASRAEQIRVAINWQARAGWKAWPVCSHVIGVR
jgi:hypothetical protein